MKKQAHQSMPAIKIIMLACQGLIITRDGFTIITGA